MNIRLAKKIILFITTAALIVAIHPTVFGQSVSELRKQRDTLAREIERKRQELEKKKQEAAKLAKQIQSLDQEIIVTEGRIQDTGQKITDTQVEIAKLTEFIGQKGQELAAEQDHQDIALREMYVATDQNPVILMVGSKGLSEAVDRGAYLEALGAQIKMTIATMEVAKLELEKQRADQQAKEAELNDLRQRQEMYRIGLDSQKKFKDKLLTNTQKTQEEIEQQIADAKKAYNDINSELYRIQEASRRKLSAGGSKKLGSISFIWPNRGIITTHFGESTRVQSRHTGLDIDCSIGDTIVATASGRVVFAGGDRSYGYGIYVKIDHGEGVYTLSGHLSGLEVAGGDEVKQGQTIGYCGNTGFAYAFSPTGDGSHNHQEIRVLDNGVEIPVDPLPHMPT